MDKIMEFLPFLIPLVIVQFCAVWIYTVSYFNSQDI